MEAVAHLLELEPNFRITESATRNRLSKLQIFIDGLRKAGFPE
jgi:adenylate cyclase